MSDLEYYVDRHVATIRLNRPHRKNAFTLSMVDDWASALSAASEDPEVRVIVLTGSGGSFCSGVDLSDFKADERDPLAEKELLSKRVHRVALTMEDIDKPVLAAIQGAAVGAGLDMALLCDVRFASRTARFCEGYIRVGLVPGDGGCWLLPRVVGTSTALRMLWTGSFVDADEALRIGLVDELHEDDDLLDAVYAYSRDLAGQPPIAIQMIKRAVRQGANHDLRTALDLISSHQAVITSTRDSREAFLAFSEHRSGDYLGR